MKSGKESSMKNKKVLIEKTIIIILLIGAMLYAFKLKSDERVSLEEAKNKVIISEVVNMSGKKIDEIQSILGKAEGIHKDKVYTYKDSIAKYDLLVVDEVKSAVITFNKRMSKEEVYKMLSIKGDLLNTKSLVEEEFYEMYDKETDMKIEMITNKNDEVKTVKIAYK